jgi:hypothetical protein
MDKLGCLLLNLFLVRLYNFISSFGHFPSFYGFWVSSWNRTTPGFLILPPFCFSLFPWMRLTISWPQDLKDFVRSAGEVTYADVDRDGRG